MGFADGGAGSGKVGDGDRGEALGGREVGGACWDGTGLWRKGQRKARPGASGAVLTNVPRFACKRVQQSLIKKERSDG